MFPCNEEFIKMTKTLLVTDDAAVMREIIKSTVRDKGWTVVGEAADGQAAIDRYAELRPDAVTLDLVMPDFDGLHALRGILKIDPAARVLVVSAVEQKSILREAFKAGATDFVVKPFERQGLLETLERIAASAADGKQDETSPATRD
jgi:two-component system, chemotaxis family, chemotaxis protein CheY